MNKKFNVYKYIDDEGKDVYLTATPDITYLEVMRAIDSAETDFDSKLYDYKLEFLFQSNDAERVLEDFKKYKFTVLEFHTKEIESL